MESVLLQVVTFPVQRYVLARSPAETERTFSPAEVFQSLSIWGTKVTRKKLTG